MTLRSSIGLSAMLTLGCTPMLQANVGYGGSLERPGERHGAAVHATLGYESFIGAEIGARAAFSDTYNVAALYSGLLFTNMEDPIRFTLRTGIHIVQGEWFGERPVLGVGSPLAEVGLRVQLTGRAFEGRGGYFPWGATYHAARTAGS